MVRGRLKPGFREVIRFPDGHPLMLRCSRHSFLSGGANNRAGVSDMIWSDLTADWAKWFKRIQKRFPNLDDSAMPFVKQDRSRFESYIAGTHNLSLREAHEELDDFLFVETLAGEAGTPRD